MNYDEIQRKLAELNSNIATLSQKGRYEEAIQFAQQSCSKSKLLGENHPDYAMSLNNLADLYTSIKKHENAEPIYLQVLEIRKKTLGNQHPLYAQTLQSLVLLYQSIGAYEKAEPLLQEVLQIVKKVQGEEHPEFALYLTNLADLYRMERKFKEAEPLYQKAGTIYRKTIGEDNQYYATNLNNLAYLYHLKGEYDAAEPLYLKSGLIFRKTLGENHPDYAMNLNNLANLYTAVKKYEKAEPIYLQVLEIRKKTLGNQHPLYAQTLQSLGLLYQSIGAYDKAKPHLQESVEIIKNIQGENHPDYAISLSRLATCYKLSGKYNEAELLYRKALDIQKKVSGEGNPDYLNILKDMACLLSAMGKFDEAESIYKTNLDKLQQIKGEDDFFYAQGLNYLANLNRDLGRYKEAASLYRRSLEIRKRVLGEYHPEYATNLNDLAYLYQITGEYDKAESHYNQSKEIYLQTLGTNHPHFATSLNNLALLHYYGGSYDKAEPLFQQALDIWKDVIGERHPDYAQCLNNLTLLYVKLGAFTKAESLFKRALAIWADVVGEDHPDYLRCMANLALLYMRMGLSNKAEPLLIQVLQKRKKVLGEHHPEYAHTLGHLATLYSYMGKYRKAESTYHQSLQITKMSLGEDHPDYVQILVNLSILFFKMGEIRKAETLLEKSIPISRRVLGENHPVYADHLNILAELYGSTNRFIEARELLMQSSIVDDLTIGQIFSIGSDEQRLGYLDSIRYKVDIFISLVFRHFSQNPEVIQDAFTLILKRKAITAEALAAQRDAILEGKYPHLQDQVRQLTRLRQQITQKTLAGPGKEGGDKHHQKLSVWNAEKEHLEQDLARQVPEIKLEQQFRTADRTVIAHTLPPGSSLVEFFRFHEFDFTAVPTTGQRRWKPARYCAFVLPTGEPDHVTMIDLGEADQIDQLIAIYKSKLTEKGRAAVQSCPEKQPGMLTRLFGKKPEEAALSSSRDIGVVPEPVLDKLEKESGLLLYSALIAPICDVIGNRVHLILAPDSQLSTIPFEVIPTPDGGYLIDLYHISYVGVGRDVLRFTTRFLGKPEKALVMASPAYDLHIGLNSKEKAQIPFLERKSRDLSRGSYHFTPLPGTKIEGKKIATLLGVSPLLDEDALEARLKSVSSPLLLHIATHGFFLKDQEMSEGKLGRDFGLLQDPGMQRFSGRGMENPMLRSGLALAGVNTWMKNGELPPEAEDGILTAEDVSGLDLSNTSLAVLSACETGLGDVKTGEGVFGLRRAFTLSGANTLLMSLWKVPDLATQELMVDFYKRVLAGTPKAEALRESQLALRKKYPHPKDWGAFICQGDPGPLKYAE